MAHLGAGAAIALVAGLAGCNDRATSDGRLPLTGASYCTPFRTANSATAQTGLATAPVNTADPGTAFDDCVHRWAYAMAPARDPADVVAHAAVDACGAAMNAWNQQLMASAEARSLFYVVQARAAGCAPPPANTLVSSPS
jgi:hypothetical protein